MTTPKRIQMSRQHPWKHLITNLNGHVICDRRSYYGNPFIVEQHGSRWIITCDGRRVAGYFSSKRNAALVAINEYKNRTARWLDKHPLHGRDLCCWCRLCDAHKDGRPLNIDCQDCEPCHVDILGKLANPELFEVKE